MFQRTYVHVWLSCRPLLIILLECCPERALLRHRGSAGCEIEMKPYVFAQLLTWKYRFFVVFVWAWDLFAEGRQCTQQKVNSRQVPTLLQSLREHAPTNTFSLNLSRQVYRYVFVSFKFYLYRKPGFSVNLFKYHASMRQWHLWIVEVN